MRPFLATLFVLVFATFADAAPSCVGGVCAVGMSASVASHQASSRSTSPVAARRGILQRIFRGRCR